jgi:hypothetical protein
MTLTFTPFTHFFNFYYLQRETEIIVHWIVFSFLAYGVYKLLKAMTS